MSDVCSQNQKSHFTETFPTQWQQKQMHAKKHQFIPCAKSDAMWKHKKCPVQILCFNGTLEFLTTNTEPRLYGWIPILFVSCVCRREHVDVGGSDWQPSNAASKAVEDACKLVNMEINIAQLKTLENMGITLNMFVRPQGYTQCRSNTERKHDFLMFIRKLHRAPLTS